MQNYFLKLFWESGWGDVWPQRPDWLILQIFFILFKAAVDDNNVTGRKTRTNILVEAGFLDKLTSISNYAEQSKIIIFVKQGFATTSSTSVFKKSEITPYNTEQEHSLIILRSICFFFIYFYTVNDLKIN